MTTMRNSENGEPLKMTTEEFMKAMREGNITIQQTVQHADGTVTSSTIYGNDIGDGLDRSMNIFGTMNEIFNPALIKAKKFKEANKNAENIFFMDDSDINYEVTVDDTATPVMHIITCKKDSVKVARYIRDERKTVGVPTDEITLPFKNGKIVATLDEIYENSMIVFAFGLFEIRKVLRERGILQELQKIGNKSSGVVISTNESEINAKIVRGFARPDLPCLMFGGFFSQSMEDAIMMRPYLDEIMAAEMYEDMSLDDKIAAAEDGNTYLMEQLAIYYLDECEKPDGERAVYWFKKMAEAGISTAMFSLGLHYAKGFGVERDLEKAAYWMQKAADNGDETAEPIAKQYKTIAQIKEKADNGDAAAQAKLVGYFTRIATSLAQAGPEADFKLAFEYANKSANQNNSDGIWELALCYEHGQGVKKDIGKAIELYRKGADMGHAPSLHSLDCLLMRGNDSKSANSASDNIKKKEHQLAKKAEEEKKNKEQAAKEYMENTIAECYAKVNKFCQELDVALKKHMRCLKEEINSVLAELNKQKTDKEAHLATLGFFDFSDKKAIKKSIIEIDNKIARISDPKYIQEEEATIREAFNKAKKDYSQAVNQHIDARFPTRKPKPVEYDLTAKRFLAENKSCSFTKTQVANEVDKWKILLALAKGDKKTIGDIQKETGIETSQRTSALVRQLKEKDILFRTESKGCALFSLVDSAESVLEKLPKKSTVPIYEEVAKVAKEGCPIAPCIENIEIHSNK